MISRTGDPVRDPVLSDDFVLSLARRHVPDATAVAGVDESGGEARCYLIDDNLVLNTQRPHRVRPRTSLEKHGFFLDQLAGDPEVRVARKLGHGRKGGVEYLLMTRIPGIAFRYATLSMPTRRGVLEALGRTLRRVHSRPLAPFLESGLFPADRSPAAFRERVQGALEEALQAINDRGDWRYDQSPEAVANRVLDALPPSLDKWAPLHSNPGPEHVFVDPDSDEFTGLIDFGDAYISHPAMDFRRWRSAEDHDAVLAGYTAEEPLSDAFLAVWHALLVVGAMGTLGRGPGRFDQTVDDLPKLLAALPDYPSPLAGEGGI